MELNNSIFENRFDISFSSFKGLRETEYNLLKDTFQKIDNDYIIFDMNEIDKKVQPLEIIIKTISNKLLGILDISLLNTDNDIIGVIHFKNFKFKKIDNLIKFDFTTENKNKKLKVSYECDEILYTGKNGKEEVI